MKYLKELGLGHAWVNSNLVVNGERDKFEDWMYIEFEMNMHHAFTMGGHTYLVFSYHDTDDIILVKVLIPGCRYCLINLSTETINTIKMNA